MCFSASALLASDLRRRCVPGAFPPVRPRSRAAVRLGREGLLCCFSVCWWHSCFAAAGCTLHSFTLTPFLTEYLACVCAMRLRRLLAILSLGHRARQAGEGASGSGNDPSFISCVHRSLCHVSDSPASVSFSPQLRHDIFRLWRSLGLLPWLASAEPFWP